MKGRGMKDDGRKGNEPRVYRPSERRERSSIVPRLSERSERSSIVPQSIANWKNIYKKTFIMGD